MERRGEKEGDHVRNFVLPRTGHEENAAARQRVSRIGGGKGAGGFRQRAVDRKVPDDAHAVARIAGLREIVCVLLVDGIDALENAPPALPGKFVRTAARVKTGTYARCVQQVAAAVLSGVRGGGAARQRAPHREPYVLARRYDAHLREEAACYARFLSGREV